MNKQEGEILALVLLTVGETGHAFSAFLPSHFTIRNWVLSGSNGQIDQNIANLRSGYVPATAFGVGLGAAISFLARSPLPLIASVAASGAMILLYEQALPPERRLLNTLWGQPVVGERSRTAAPAVNPPAKKPVL